MSYRCVNAFVFADKMYANGCVIADDDAILRTHTDHFARVDETVAAAAAVEQAVAEPGGLRSVTPPKKKLPPPAKRAVQVSGTDKPEGGDE